MTEPFAQVWLSDLQSGTRVVVGGVSIEGAGKNEADKINAAFESAVSERVKKAVEEFRKRAVALMREHPCAVSIYGDASTARGAKSAADYLAALVENLPAALEEK